MAHLKTPRLQMPHLQTGVFQTVVTVAFELCVLSNDFSSNFIDGESQALGQAPGNCSHHQEVIRPAPLHCGETAGDLSPQHSTHSHQPHTSTRTPCLVLGTGFMMTSYVQIIILC